MINLEYISLQKLEELLPNSILEQLNEKLLKENRCKAYNCVFYIDNRCIDCDNDEYVGMFEKLVKQCPFIFEDKNKNGITLDDIICHVDHGSALYTKCIFSVEESEKILDSVDPKYLKYFQIMRVRKYSTVCVYSEISEYVGYGIFPHGLHKYEHSGHSDHTVYIDTFK
uniref:Uncharacterized protein n=1 Tax=Pithovirus LCPAC101 TaxID=2506586 RepID=A0A481Z442_9VIRU|nr:MAG: hypothetical protein LCPAC101_00420 [Pithovirus LCPAC101]